MDPIPFHVPSLDEADVEGVVDVLRTGWVTTGPKCREFEARFAEFLTGASGETVHAIAVNSCTSALHLALEACGIGPGDRVLVPVMTFTATAEVVRYLGADPVFVDVDARDFNITPDLVRAAVADLAPADRDRIKALVPVHYGGRACDMAVLEALCCENGWSLVDDAAHALPTRCGDRWIGRWGRATAFSFYATKTLCTGEGGMIVTRDAELAERMRVMRLHGISRDAFDRYRSAEPAWYYEVVAPGFKYNLGDMAAALGLSQLRRLHEFRDARARIAARYGEGFARVEGMTVPVDAEPGDLHAWHLYPLRVSGGRAVRDALIDELAADQIGTSVHFIPLHLHPYWRDRYGLKPEQFPTATQLFEEEISLPIFVSMRDAQVERVIEVLPRALERARAKSAGTV
jgi:dTDP-4-amino-4,6-dideoxygalactose transaminase